MHSGNTRKSTFFTAARDDGFSAVFSSCYEMWRETFCDFCAQRLWFSVFIGAFCTALASKFGYISTENHRNNGPFPQMNTRAACYLNFPPLRSGGGLGERVSDIVYELKFWFFIFAALTPALSHREREHIGGLPRFGHYTER